MSDALAVIIGAIIASITGLLGVFGGQWLASRSARSDRDDARSAAVATVRREAYAALLSAVDAVITEYRKDLRGSVMGPVFGPTVDRAAAVVQLVGPAEVARAVVAYAEAIKSGSDHRQQEAHFIEIARPQALPSP